MKRLGYKKSRNGCQRCKQRRIKCNETVPCSACTRHQVPCSLQNAQTQEASPFVSGHLEGATQLRNSLSPSSSQSSSNLEAPRPDSADRIPCFPKFLDSTQRGSAKDQISDLELMHHYTSTAYQTFSSWEGVRQTLQCHVPREGFTQPPLLHQILAFSGFHLAYLHPERRHSYLVQASLHQDQAVAGINSALAAGVTSVNCHALYASSVFLLICAFATYPSCEVYHRAYESLDGLIGIFRLAHGISLISRSSHQDLRKGPLQGLFAGKSGPTAPSEHIRLLVDQLLNLKRQLSVPTADRAGSDTDLVLEAAELLADCLLSVHQNYSFSAPAEVRAALLWPLRMSDGFLALVQQREPLAMVLLAHYCVLLRYAETACWFIKGWAATLITIIRKNIGGGPCESMIHWPNYLINKFSVVPHISAT